MKYIEKRSEPRELREWFHGQPIENGHRMNCHYKDMPGGVKSLVKRSLLYEQGSLCCYTGMRIDESNSHIEHLKPQNRCEGHEDVEYTNLLAAYPLAEPGSNAPQCRFGAHAKAGWYERDLFVSPLVRRCETRFRFDMQGRIGPARPNDLAAERTIRQLKLDDGSLDEMRRDAIEEALFPEDNPLSAAKLQTIIEKGFSSRDGQGRFPRFCFVIEQVAAQVLHKAERDRKRREAIHKQSRK